MDVVKGMDAKSGSDFENLERVDGRREGRFNIEALRKSSQNSKPNRYRSTRRNVNAIDALRAWAKENQQSHYSIYSLSEVLFSLGHEELTQWRYANKVKTAFYQLALRQMEKDEEQALQPDEDRLRLVPFSFNLSKELQQRLVKSKRKEMTRCMDIINRALKHALGRDVDIWFQYEMAPKANNGKPHIQGALLMKVAEEVRVRKAFHKCNGNVSVNFKKRALELSLEKREEWTEKYGLLYTDLNWASYCAKETARTLLSFVDQDIDDWGKVVAVSRSLSSKSKLIFDGLRSTLQTRTHQQVTF